MKSTKKTVRQYYEMLPEPYRSQAIKNCRDEHGESRLDREALSLHHAIDYGMYWSATPEGSSYWGDLADKAAHGKIELCPEGLYQIY